MLSELPLPTLNLQLSEPKPLPSHKPNSPHFSNRHAEPPQPLDLRNKHIYFIGIGGSGWGRREQHGCQGTSASSA